MNFGFESSPSPWVDFGQTEWQYAHLSMNVQASPVQTVAIMSIWLRIVSRAEVSTHLCRVISVAVQSRQQLPSWRPASCQACRRWQPARGVARRIQVLPVARLFESSIEVSSSIGIEHQRHAIERLDNECAFQGLAHQRRTLIHCPRANSRVPSDPSSSGCLD